MQIPDIDLVLILIAGTAVLLTVGAAYIVMMVTSHRRVVAAQEARLEEVSRSEEKYRGIFDNSLAGIMKFSPDTWVVDDSNAAIRSIFGCLSPDDFQGCMDGVPMPTRTIIRETLAKDGFIAGYELRTARNDGKELWILFSAKQLKGEPLAQAVVIDITERKQFVEKIREQSTLLDQTQDAIMVMDADGKVTFWNSGAELMYGWQRGAVQGKPVGDLLYNPARTGDFRAAMEDVRQFHEWHGEHFHRRMDGKEIFVESRWRTVEKGTNGSRSILIVNSDITERRRLESQFIRAQKMESIALLTGGMAHDLQNILAPVSMSVPLLRKKLSDKSSTAILDVVEQSANSGLELVKNVLTYGRGIVGERMPIDLNPLLDQVLSIVSHGLPAPVRVVRRANCSPALILGDVNQLKQVFLNLCVNARDAMGGQGGELMVETSAMDSEERLLEYNPEAEPGSYVRVCVADTGKGIPAEDLDRIFEPFFTTRESGEGTGLGLSIAHGIVKSHKGFITVESVEGKGTTFCVFLPAHSVRGDDVKEGGA